MSVLPVSTVNPFVAEWVIKPLPSRLLLGFVALTHLLALCVLLLLPGLVFWVVVVLAAAVLGSLVYQWLLHSARLPARWVEFLYWRESGGWEVTTAAGSICR